VTYQRASHSWSIYDGIAGVITMQASGVSPNSNPKIPTIRFPPYRRRKTRCHPITRQSEAQGNWQLHCPIGMGHAKI